MEVDAEFTENVEGWVELSMAACYRIATFTPNNGTLPGKDIRCLLGSIPLETDETCVVGAVDAVIFSEYNDSTGKINAYTKVDRPKGTGRKRKQSFTYTLALMGTVNCPEGVLALLNASKIRLCQSAFSIFLEHREQLCLSVYLKNTYIAPSLSASCDYWLLDYLSTRHARRHFNPVIAAIFPSLKIPLQFDDAVQLPREDFDMFYEKLRRDRAKPPEYELDTSAITATLRPYQKDAVRFMIDREMNPDLPVDPHITQVHHLANNIYYFPHVGLFAESPDFHAEVRGGILADEMGLGKTVELLALITSISKQRPVAPLENDSQRRRRLSQLWDDPVRDVVDDLVSSVTASVDTGEALWKLNEIRARRFFSKPKSKLSDASSLPHRLDCKACGESVDRSLMALSRSQTAEDFTCPFCYQHMVLDVGTTLIVVPSAICLQWYEEIRKHIRETVSIHLYQGVIKDGYKHPKYLAEHDIILTTYDVLQKELVVVDYKPKEGLRKKRGDAHQVLPSPLTSVKWWRICLDESQMVEGGARKAAEMCFLLKARARWCITGTPLLNSVNDLYGMVRFLGLRPFSLSGVWVDNLWAPYTHGEEHRLLAVFKKLFWRNAKKDVQDQLDLPCSSVTVTELTFTPLEERTYQAVLAIVRPQIAKLLPDNYAPDVLLKDLGLQVFHGIWKALTRLRTSVVTGDLEHWASYRASRKFILKRTFTPQRIFSVLHRMAVKLMVEEIRNVVANRNAVAGLLWLYGDKQQACEWYKKIWQMVMAVKEINEKLGLFDRTRGWLQLIDNTQNEFTEEDLDLFEEELVQEEVIKEANKAVELDMRTEDVVTLEVVRIDSLQMAHFAKNMLELNDEFPELQPLRGTANVGVMKQILGVSINRFLSKDVEHLHKKRRALGADVRKFEMSSTQKQKFESGTLELFRVVDNFPVLAAQMTLYATQAFNPSTKFRDPSGNTVDSSLLGKTVCEEMSELVADVHNILEILDLLVEHASGSEKISRRSEHSHAPSGLFAAVMECQHYYESQMSQRDKEERKRTEPDWKPTEELTTEELFSSRCAFCIVSRLHFNLKTRVVPNDDAVMSDCFIPLEGLFLYAKRLLERSVSHTTIYQEASPAIRDAAHVFTKSIDNLRLLIPAVNEVVLGVQDMAFRWLELQQSFRRVYPGMEIFRPGGGRRDPLIRIEVDEEPDQDLLEAFKVFDVALMQEYSKKLSSLNYLHESVADERICPVCYCQMENSWMVFPCAHCICSQCFVQLKQICRDSSAGVRCPTCRSSYVVEAVAQVTNRRKLQSMEEEHFWTDGETLSTKIDAILRRINSIMTKDPSAKILVFTSLAAASHHIMEGLVICKIQHVFLYADMATRDAFLNEFKFDQETRVCLMPLASCASGLNLTQANHIIFAEPVVENSVEAQAIGRINRIGQTRPITIHHFVVKHSIEQEIHRLHTSNNREEDGWTLGTLRSVLGV